MIHLYFIEGEASYPRHRPLKNWPVLLGPVRQYFSVVCVFPVRDWKYILLPSTMTLMLLSQGHSILEGSSSNIMECELRRTSTSSALDGAQCTPTLGTVPVMAICACTFDTGWRLQVSSAKPRTCITTPKKHSDADRPACPLGINSAAYDQGIRSL